MKISEDKLGKAETAIEALADAIGVSEDVIVKYLKEGMEIMAPIGGSLVTPRSISLMKWRRHSDTNGKNI